LKIIIDATYSPSGGALTQVINMVEEFNSIKGVELVIYSKESNKEIFDKFNNNIIVSRMAGISVISRIFWCQFILPICLLNAKGSVLFCPGNFSPILSPIKTVVWIGTIGPFFKDFYTGFSLFDKLKLYINKLLIVASSKTADVVIFESLFTKNMFADRYNFLKSKGHVINIGLDNYFTDRNGIDLHIKSLVGEGDFILCVSHLYPYKNIIKLLQSFRGVLDQSNHSINLVIAGSMDYKSYNDRILKCIDKLKLNNNVILLGRVSKGDLKYLYYNCDLLVFPSPYENFAYTLVEAMSCGTPIVCSNTTAMPESCKDAAVYFNPFNKVDIMSKIILVLNNKILKKSLSQKSLLRIKELPSYKESTIMTYKIMKSIVK
jgi:glycosyltransferase involved in cell wall biosynthesis